MLVYEAGGFNHGFAHYDNGSAAPTAADFASADIVLTTYETLQRDLHRHGLEQRERRLRRPKKYQVTGLILSQQQGACSPNIVGVIP